jgi:quercetin dioxygenase-like cupin family protein
MVRPIPPVLTAGVFWLVVAVPPTAAQHPHTAGHVIVTAAEITWQDPPPSLPPGARIAVIEGDPSRPGAFAMRARMPANYRIATHWHDGAERVTVLAGSVVIGLGVGREAGERRLPVGSFFSMAPGTVHDFRTEEETIIQINGFGPWGINYVNPADDPSGRPATAEGAADLAAIRRATEKYRDVNVALADGYVPDPNGMCVTAAMEGLPRQAGGMGIHYFRPDLLGITATEPRVNGTGTHQDFARPGVLVYEPQADGTLVLVAIENLVWAAAWRDAGNSGPPSFMGNDYYYMIDNPLTEADEAHGFEPHYELHLWLYRSNPNGMFTQFNPTVTCGHHHGHGGRGER